MVARRVAHTFMLYTLYLILVARRVAHTWVVGRRLTVPNILPSRLYVPSDTAHLGALALQTACLPPGYTLKTILLRLNFLTIPSLQTTYLPPRVAGSAKKMAAPSCYPPRRTPSVSCSPLSSSPLSSPGISSSACRVETRGGSVGTSRARLPTGGRRGRGLRGGRPRPRPRLTRPPVDRPLRPPHPSHRCWTTRTARPRPRRFAARKGRVGR